MVECIIPWILLSHFLVGCSVMSMSDHSDGSSHKFHLKGEKDRCLKEGR